MAQVHNPPHPGETLREDVLPKLGLTVSEAARQLGVSRVQVSRVLHGREPVSPDLALRLEQMAERADRRRVAQNADRVRFVAGAAWRKTSSRRTRAAESSLTARRDRRMPVKSWSVPYFTF